MNDFILTSTPPNSFIYKLIKNIKQTWIKFILFCLISVGYYLELHIAISYTKWVYHFFTQLTSVVIMHTKKYDKT